LSSRFRGFQLESVILGSQNALQMSHCGVCYANRKSNIAKLASSNANPIKRHNIEPLRWCSFIPRTTKYTTYQQRLFLLKLQVPQHRFSRHDCHGIGENVYELFSLPKSLLPPAVVYVLRDQLWAKSYPRSAHIHDLWLRYS